ncbi:MAG: hypothetical protein RR951_02365, partial [Ruthenibacterium sp.]
MQTVSASIAKQPSAISGTLRKPHAGDNALDAFGLRPKRTHATTPAPVAMATSAACSIANFAQNATNLSMQKETAQMRREVQNKRPHSMDAFFSPAEAEHKRQGVKSAQSRQYPSAYCR